MKKKILILTKSKKHNAKCVVGVDIETKELIRLITDDKNIHYSLSDEHLLYEDNTPVKLLDIAEVDFISSKPSARHPEDWLINTNKKFKYIDKFCLEKYEDCVSANITKDDFIYGNSSHFLTENEFNKENKSIILAYIENIKFNLKQSQYSTKIIAKISFEYNNLLYQNFSFTSDYSNFKDCPCAIAVITLPDGSDNFCKEHNQFYKFVAQIYPITKKTVNDKNKSNSDFIQKLSDELKRYRSEKAKLLKIPAYCIFNDKSLNEIIKELPTCVEKLQLIYGFGAKRANEFGDDIIKIVLKFLNENPEIINNKTEGAQTLVPEVNFNIKNAILSCIREFNGKYGRGGIAKILKGSTGLKENDHNNDSINSKYYGLFKQLTLSYITSEIDELIKNEMLVTTKVSFGRPILKINPKYENEIDSIAENIILNDTNETNDDENILRVVYLIKQKKNVFITGHAGTGKSYILSKLKEKIPKLVITSTTGIAAVNVKGQTIHSWAGIGICNRLIEQTVEKILKKSSVKNQIQKCKILAIDEISMLDIKTFEYVDSVLRQVRSCDEPFGGIQVLFIGDFFQLPPVEKNENSAQKYCFESKLWEDLDLYTVLLTKNYRQNEENLITALSNMRTNSLTDADVKLLKTRECKENIDTENALHIFATNQEADNYNNMKFNKINSEEYKLFAIDGVYKGEKLVENPTNIREENILKRIDVVCSAEKSISLKIGVRVMLLINYDFEKGLINGSCGEVKEINEDYILVYFDNGQCAKITRHDFEFYNNEKLIALRKQFPLRLAYGITIHKSQGMSLDKLVVDCSRIFEKGQAYVALSRIKTLNGLYLHNFNPAKVMVDNTVVEFYKNLKIFDKKVELTENINISQQQKENSLDNKLEDESIEYYVDKIKNIILENNRWIEIFEIAEMLGVNRHKKLVEDESNSTIAHLINRRLKKEGFITKRINYDKGYSIVVAPPGFSTDNIPEEIQVSSYKNRK